MQKPDITNKIARAALVAGMVILAVFAMFGALKLLPTAFSSLASVGTAFKSSLFSPSEKIILSLSNNSVASGEETHVSFEHQDRKESGSYQFRFECLGKDITMTIIDASGRKEVSCGSKAPIDGLDFGLIPTLTDKNSYVDSTIFVDFIKDGSKSASITGRTVITIHSGTTSASATATKATSTKIYSAAKNTQSPVQQAGIVKKSDLYIVTKDVGVVVNGIFVPRTTAFSSNERASVRFDIGNQGNVATGIWQFVAALPTNPSQTFSSGSQPSLNPGEVIEYTLTLDNLARTGANVVTINVDPAQTVNELSYTNNSASMTVVGNSGYVSTNYYNTNNNYYYGQPNLSGKVLATGFIDRTTGIFYEAASVPSGSRAAVQIEIQNTGSGTSGSFIVTADIPSTVTNSYISPTQSPLAGGEKRQLTIAFDYPTHYNDNNVIIHIDPNYTSNDSNRNDNTFTATVRTY